jgi:hypothetical protein
MTPIGDHADPRSARSAPVAIRAIRAPLATGNPR